MLCAQTDDEQIYSEMNNRSTIIERCMSPKLPIVINDHALLRSFECMYE